MCFLTFRFYMKFNSKLGIKKILEKKLCVYICMCELTNFVTMIFNVIVRNYML